MDAYYTPEERAEILRRRDDVPFVTDKAGHKIYIGYCDGCGGRYTSRDWHLADQSACSGCYPESWGQWISESDPAFYVM